MELNDDPAVLWADFKASVESRFGQSVQHKTSLFATSATGLYKLYLKNLPFDRSVHTCAACRTFIERFGGLVCIDANGDTYSPLWHVDSNTPDFYARSVAAMEKAALAARVTGVFLTSDAVIGTSTTPGWSHLCARVPASARYDGATVTAEQAMAAKAEDFRTVENALAEFDRRAVSEAIRVLESETMFRSEKFVEPMKWLGRVHDDRAARRGTAARDNVLWTAVAAAPSGFCHVKSSVTGSLLEDIRARKSFDTVKRNFEAKLDPTKYQRPFAAPAAQNIVRAEKLFEQLNLAPALKRRFARLEDLHVSWNPRTERGTKAPSTGVFRGVKPRGAARPDAGMSIPGGTMTWVKFRERVLPHADKMTMTVPSIGNFIALTAAVHADAPRLFKWDNDVAGYMYVNAAERQAYRWGLASGSRVEVSAVTSLPTMWGDRPMPFVAEGDVLILKGCVDGNAGHTGIFPECLREELHEVRATIEAYAKDAKPSGRQFASACGYDVRRSVNPIDIVLHVTHGGGSTEYRIDRWD